MVIIGDQAVVLTPGFFPLQAAKIAKAAKEAGLQSSGTSDLSQDGLNWSPLSKKWKPQICWGTQVAL